MDLLIATENPGKQREIYSLLEGFPAVLHIPGEMNLSLAVEEDGDTYAENAARKALAYAYAANLLSMADDSGLEVDALEGKPGIRSARFSPLPGASDTDRRSYLLEQLRSFPPPWKARFRCTIALASPFGVIRFAEGVCEGEVIPEERGSNGFGYDPIFLLPELSRTMAELTMEEKNIFSHRARAVKAALPILKELLGDMRA